MSTLAPPSPFGAAVIPAVPSNENDLAALVRDASARGQPLHIEGGGSKRHHGPAAAAGCQPVSLRGLNRVTAYEPGDMVVSVLAGTRLIDLQRTLAEHRQWLPIDPPYANATIGGILATASAGPRRLGYGTIKDALLGMRIMGVQGGITSSGARVVKNVSGFDLHRLQVGAFGVLGIILEAHLKVTTRPALTGALLLGQPDIASALRLLLQVQSTALRPVALEALDAGAIASCRTLVPEIPDAPAVAVVGFEGSRAVFDRHVNDLTPLRAQVRAATLLEGSATERLWQGFRDAPARTLDQISFRLGARPHDLPVLLEGFDLRAAGVTGVSCHAGNGIARLRFVRPTDPAAWTAQLARLGEAARARGGYLVAESAPPGLPGRETLPWATGAPNPLSRRIKDAWDPSSILNPGRAPL